MHMYYVFMHLSADNKSTTKLICYTRSSSSIDHLPDVFPRLTFSTTEEQQKSKKIVEALIYEKVIDAEL